MLPVAELMCFAEMILLALILGDVAARKTRLLAFNEDWRDLF